MISHINLKWKKQYKKLPQDIRQIAKKQYKLFKQNPYHSSLHFKLLHFLFLHLLPLGIYSFFLQGINYFKILSYSS